MYVCHASVIGYVRTDRQRNSSQRHVRYASKAQQNGQADCNQSRYLCVYVHIYFFTIIIVVIYTHTHTRARRNRHVCEWSAIIGRKNQYYGLVLFFSLENPRDYGRKYIAGKRPQTIARTCTLG